MDIKILDKKYTYAIIGASNNQEKYGYRVLKDLKEFGYNVVPVNLREREILNLKVYKNILDINFKIDVVIFVVPPEVTERVLRDVKRLKIKKVWMQPGSKSEKAIKYCQDNNIEYIYNACIMIENKTNNRDL